MKQAWWILCNVGAVLIIHSMWVQMEGWDKWCAVLFTSFMWIGGILDDYSKYLKRTA